MLKQLKLKLTKSCLTFFSFMRALNKNNYLEQSQNVFHTIRPKWSKTDAPHKELCSYRCINNFIKVNSTLPNYILSFKRKSPPCQSESSRGPKSLKCINRFSRQIKCVKRFCDKKKHKIAI